MQRDRSAIVSGVVRCASDHDVANARVFRQNMNIQTLHIAVVITVATTSDAGDNVVGEVSSSKVSGEPGTISIYIFELENRSVTQRDCIVVSVNIDDCFTCNRCKKAPRLNRREPIGGGMNCAIHYDIVFCSSLKITIPICGEVSTMPISAESQLVKNRRIAQTRQETAQRRQFQAAKTYQLKIVSNKLSVKQKSVLDQAFLQAKWFTNDVINHLETGKLNDYVSSTKSVKVRLGSHSDEYEERKLTHLSSKVKQAIVSRVGDSLSAPKTLKSNGRKVGGLRYVKEVDSLPLNQYGNTHRIINDTTMHIVKIGRVKVRGLRQIPQDAEFATATLNRKPDGYYVHLTVFIPVTLDLSWETRPDIGIDLGIKDTLITSTGEKYRVRVEVSSRLKGLQRKLARQQKGSRNYSKTVQSIRREYQKISNIKNDQANKIVHELLSNSGIVFMQDEMVHNWHSGLFDKHVQVSILGRLKARLVNHPRVCVVDKRCATTQLCPECGKLNKHSLDKRVYRCSCGYSEDRDVHSARNMLVFGMDEHNVVKSPGVGRASTPVERKASAVGSSDSMASCCDEAGNRHPQPV